MPAADDRSRGRRPSSGRSGKPEQRGGRKPPPARGGKPEQRAPANRTSEAAANRRTSGTGARTARAARRGAGGATTCRRWSGQPPRRSTTARRSPTTSPARSSTRTSWRQLKSLPEKLAARVARHLVAAAQLMESDPETAYKHTLAARARASRVAVVREASGEAAYAAGQVQGSADRVQGCAPDEPQRHVPPDDGRLRARSRPSRAGAGTGQGPAGRSSSTRRPDRDEDRRVGCAAGPRRPAAAIRTLEGRELRSQSRAGWVPRLRYAYAEALLADGQVAAAREWFERAAGVDIDGYTDAAERVAALDADGSA